MRTVYFRSWLIILCTLRFQSCSGGLTNNTTWLAVCSQLNSLAIDILTNALTSKQECQHLYLFMHIISASAIDLDTFTTSCQQLSYSCRLTATDADRSCRWIFDGPTWTVKYRFWLLSKRRFDRTPQLFPLLFQQHSLSSSRSFLDALAEKFSTPFPQVFYGSQKILNIFFWAGSWHHVKRWDFLRFDFNSLLELISPTKDNSIPFPSSFQELYVM